MDRRTFITSASLGALAIGRFPSSGNNAKVIQRDFSLTGPRFRYTVPGLARPGNVLFISDTHLWRTDEREDAYRQYSDRMAGAYNQTQHVITHEHTTPEESFEASLAYGREKGVDLVVLGGDIFSFPSEAAIEWTVARLEAAGLPYVYTAGNHDWHYEGMASPVAELREKWSARRLRPLYRGDDPLMSYRDVNGVRFIVLDNSTYEITPEQLEFFRIHVRSGGPCFLVVHIPLYTPGRPVSFGCGHPEWGAASDRNHEIERRERWPEGGHTSTTLAFHEAVFDTPNLLGILAGHTHTASLDLFRGIPQVVASPNASGGYIHLELV
ncbi:metallophosphoesterase family protein [Parapedobacter soli]|uniref:metallophosphoesterase family protein n=1 Tax=Parapedobacter soli TaxID=416955 RepID=UPI0021C812F4|nr:metallophosphoesterase [Parapedobacter soli]